MMESNRKKALIVAYYLSKYDKCALQVLNYETFRAAFRDIGERLGIKPNTIKNRRDDFDSIHDNGRSGWYQKELSKSSLEVVGKFEGVSEDALIEIVKEILCNSADGVMFDVLDDENAPSKNQVFNNRGVTGRKAEELFFKYFNRGYFVDFIGELIDTRDEGCGYDFKIAGELPTVFEVKGLSSQDGGISFTDKEWTVAKQLRERYVLVIIRNVFVEPELKIVKDPYGKITPIKRVNKVISVNWTFQSKDLI